MAKSDQLRACTAVVSKVDILGEDTLNIIIPTERFWPDFAGWIQQTLKIARVAADEGELRFTSISRAPVASERNAHTSLPSNVTLHRVGPPISRNTFTAQAQFVLRAIMELLRRRKQVDVLFMPYVFFPGFVFLLAGKLMGIPTVARISGQEVSPNKSIAASLRFFALQHVSAVVALNSKDVKRLRNIGVSQKRIYQIPNGVDTERFRPVTKEERRNAKRDLGLPQDRFVISFVGILCQRKGVLELVQAYRQVADESSKSSYLVLAGPCDANVQEVDSDYVKQVRQHVNQMDEQVCITGTIDHVPVLLRASDIFVLPSYAEGMPNVLLEAMATGLPCIATEIPGIKDLIDNEVEGLLVKPGNIDGLQAALHRLKAESELRLSLGRAARQRIEEYCSVDATARQYIRLFQKVSSRHDQ